VTAPQLFPTPPDLAARMAEIAKIQPRHRVLEPSAGTGNLVRAAFETAPIQLVAVEINPTLAALIRSSWGQVEQESRIEVRCGDFLECQPDDLGLFDAVLMNPPFDHGLDIMHIHHANRFLRPGGILAAICANGPRQRAVLKPRASFWEDLPAGSFKAAGTSVNTALLMIQRPHV
jgi:protein-L-isoaspartate O-methyltransferase